MANDVLYLVPGWLCDRNLWRHQYATLRQHLDVRFPEERDFETLQDSATALLKVAPERFSIAGHSLGGRIALEVYRQAPERIERIALLNTSTSAGTQNEKYARQTMLTKALANGPGVIAREVLIPSLHPGNRTDRQITGAVMDMVERLSPEYLERQFAAMLNRPDSTDVLNMIDVPAMILFSHDDRNLPFERHGEIAARVRTGKLVLVEDCGHMSPLEQPRLVTRALEEWMARPVKGRALRVAV
jgi:pimeloyl-ACP methyl ester carboxylesterase